MKKRLIRDWSMSRWGCWALSRVEDRGIANFCRAVFNDVIGVVGHTCTIRPYIRCTLYYLISLDELRLSH
jgi:hypothetical protein